MTKIKIWTNTNTLAGLTDDLCFTESKADAHIALLGSKPIDLEEFPRLRGIFRAGVGRDNVPEAGAEKRGIRVVFPSPRTIDFIYDETAAFTCHLVLRMAYRDVGTLSPWVKHPRPALHDRTLLVIGTGNIGKRVMQKMSHLMTIDSYDILEHSEEELDQKLRTADVVSLHIPNLPENRGFMGVKRLGLMKDGAVLVNTARGPLVCEDALYSELQKGRLFAAFDVYWQEPYDGRLKAFHPHRFFMTPHVASTCDGFLKGCAADLRELVGEVQQEKEMQKGEKHA